MNRGISALDPDRAIGKSRSSRWCILKAFPQTELPFKPRIAIKIPSERQRITFRFIGLSLAAPERVRYRYMLDGFDHGMDANRPAHAKLFTPNLKPGGVPISRYRQQQRWACGTKTEPS